MAREDAKKCKYAVIKYRDTRIVGPIASDHGHGARSPKEDGAYHLMGNRKYKTENEANQCECRVFYNLGGL